MQSMTGFGHGSAGAGRRRFSVEVRSVNHRGLDVKIRSREPDATCDTEITRCVRAAVSRGAVTVSVREEQVGLEAGRIDADGVKAAHGALEIVRRELGIAAPVDLATVAAFLHGSGPPRTDDLHGEALWAVLQPAVTQALAAMSEMRRREGEALAADLRVRVATINALATEIESAAAVLPARFARRLEQRVAQLAGQPIEPARLAQETLLMAERLDVSEEVVRLRTHLAHMDGLVAEGSPGAAAGDAGVGRKLDFIIQEVGRELNTIGSKAQDADITSRVIEGKLELEKIREQAQNIE